MDGYCHETKFSRFINAAPLGSQITKNADAGSEHNINFRLNRLKNSSTQHQCDPEPSQFKRALGRAQFLDGWIFQAGYNDGESWNWGKAAAK